MALGAAVVVPVVGSALLALLGLTLCWGGIREYRLQRGAVVRAEQASGSIENVSVEPVRGGSTDTYVPTAEYEYQTPTQRLRGETVYPGGGDHPKQFHDRSLAEAVIESYEPGAPATVYYDPANPDHSFLVREIQRGPNLASIGFGLGLVGLSVGVLYTVGPI